MLRQVSCAIFNSWIVVLNLGNAYVVLVFRSVQLQVKSIATSSEFAPSIQEVTLT